MTPEEHIWRWLEEHQDAATRIAAHAMVPLLTDEHGDWIGEADFPSGADYIEHMTCIMEITGLYRHTNKLQENGQAD